MTIVNPMKVLEKVLEGKSMKEIPLNVYVQVRGNIDVKKGLVNRKNYDVYLLNSTIGHKQAIEALILRANKTKHNNWFYYEQHRGIIFEIKFKLFSVSVRKLAMWDKTVGEFIVRREESGSEPANLRDFIDVISKPKKKSKRLL